MQHTCATGCGAPTNDYLCAQCLRHLINDLRAIPDLLTDLDTTYARQHVTTTGIGVRSPNATTPLPYHAAAADARTTLTNTVHHWTDTVHTHNTHLRTPPTNTTRAATWLATYPALLATHHAAADIHADITNAVRRAVHTIDRAPDHIYLGPCGADGCTRDVYAPPNRAHVRCDCGTTHDTHARRQWLLAAARDQLATAAELSRALPALIGRPITGGLIRQYAHRGKIAGRPGADRRTRYRVGDVLDALHDQTCA